MAARAGVRTPEGAEKALKRACQDFEAIFVKQVLSSARMGSPDEGLFGEDVAADIMWDMHNSHFAREISRSRSLGVAKLLFEELRDRLPDR